MHRNAGQSTNHFMYKGYMKIIKPDEALVQVSSTNNLMYHESLSDI